MRDDPMDRKKKISYHPELIINQPGCLATQAGFPRDPWERGPKSWSANPSFLGGLSMMSLPFFANKTLQFAVVGDQSEFSRAEAHGIQQ